MTACHYRATRVQLGLCRHAPLENTRAIGKRAIGRNSLNLPRQLLHETVMGSAFDRYEREIIPTKSPRTQHDNRAEMKQLRKVFEQAPIDAITPQVVAQYRDARTAKTRGNREIALLSHVWNIAREWGLTEKENPCARVRRNKEKVRDYYAGEQVWAAVYQAAPPELRDAMDLAYLTGQRPADTIKMATTDIAGGYLLVGQNKTDKRLRIRLRDGEAATGLGVFLEGLMERRALAGDPDFDADHQREWLAHECGDAEEPMG